MSRQIKEVNLALTRARCDKIRWSKELFESATQEQKELFFIYQENLEKKILSENGEWATDWELQL
jgi:ribosomal protein S18 acetylase RimI-like enzyme